MLSYGLRTVRKLLRREGRSADIARRMLSRRSLLAASGDGAVIGACAVS